MSNLSVSTNASSVDIHLITKRIDEQKKHDIVTKLDI